MRLYIVKQGDTLSSIAEKYGLTVQQLLAINPQITDPDKLMPGMKIKLAVGPVPIGPGQPDIGHSITPVGQTETPFMQIPVQAQAVGASDGHSGPGSMAAGAYVHAGSDTAPQASAGAAQASAQQSAAAGQPYGTSGQSQGMAGQMPNTPDQTHAAQQSMPMYPNDYQPYLSTIPQYFAGNPMYSGGAYGTVPTMPQGNAHNMAYAQDGSAMTAMSNLPNAVSNTPNISNASTVGTNAPNLMSFGMEVPVNPGVSQAGGMMTAGQAGSVTSPLTANQYTHSWNPNQWLGNWPQEYTWSMPFEQMSSAKPLTSVQPYAPVQLHSPVASPYQAGVKRPCGCGGRPKVGYYSLAEKRIAEGLPPESEESAQNAEAPEVTEERRASTAEHVLEQPDEIGAAESGAGEVAEPSPQADVRSAGDEPRTANISVGKTRKRTGQRRKAAPRHHAPRAHVHAGRRSGEQRETPSRPWLNV